MAVKVIDLFCGAGGFSKGASDAGAEVVVAVDNWHDALVVHQLNHPLTKHINADILQVNPESFIEDVLVHCNLQTGDVLHIHASPPCTFLSQANRQTSDEEGSILAFSKTFNLIQRFKKKVLETKENVRFTFTMEQVYHRKLFDFILVLDFKRQYQNEDIMKFRVERTNLGLFGVPQKRIRSILWNGFEFPEEQPITTIGKILGFGDDAYQRGSNYKMEKSCNNPGYTVTSMVYRVRPDPNKPWRSLTVNELLKLQTMYPYDFGHTAKMKLRKMIGNAVPSKFAEKIISQVVKGKWENLIDQ